MQDFCTGIFVVFRLPAKLAVTSCDAETGFASFTTVCKTFSSDTGCRGRSLLQIIFRVFPLPKGKGAAGCRKNI